MPDPLDYARRPRPHGVSELRAVAPRLVAGGLAAVSLFGWLIFFAFGSTAAVDTHFTNRPQDFPQFRLTPWRPLPTAQAAGASSLLTRDAFCPTTFHMLRYRQISDDGGVTAQCVAYHADVRWGPTGLALAASALIPAIAYVGLKKLLI